MKTEAIWLAGIRKTGPKDYCFPHPWRHPNSVFPLTVRTEQWPGKLAQYLVAVLHVRIKKFDRPVHSRPEIGEDIVVIPFVEV